MYEFIFPLELHKHDVVVKKKGKIIYKKQNAGQLDALLRFDLDNLWIYRVSGDASVFKTEYVRDMVTNPNQFLIDYDAYFYDH